MDKENSRVSGDGYSVTAPKNYFVSLCRVCDLQKGQNFLNSSLLGVDRLFLVVV